MIVAIKRISFFFFIKFMCENVSLYVIRLLIIRNFPYTHNLELRNPLNGIIGFTSLILDTELSEQQRDFAEAISSISSYMCNIINQSLDLCQTQSHRTTSSDIGPLRLREIVEFGFLTVTVLARTKGTELKLQDHLTPLQMVGQKYQSINGTMSQLKNVENKWYGEEDIVRKILLNYLTNAIKHTGSGVVTVRLEVESDKLQDGKEGFMAKCSVEDTGPGIPQKDLKRLFLPYSKLVSSFGELKPVKEGNNGTKSPNHQQSQRSSGLGLSICKELADKMGGKVGVESVMGKGSTFWFTFPVYTSKPESIDDEPDIANGRSESLDNGKSIKDVFWTNGVYKNGQESSNQTRDGVTSSSTSVTTHSNPKPTETNATGDSNSKNRRKHRKHKKPAKVLMVEDNEINQQIAMRYLEKLGEKVTIAANGIEALEKMKDETFDILFVDLQMPYMVSNIL
jgi:signal transduction histidine kinase/CheY-like chemotaxis protein